MTEATSKEERKTSWAKIIHAVDSPVTLFALAVLVSDAVFALAGAWCQNEKIMIFSMHMFLAILAAFVLVSVWQPVVLYHPRYWHMCKKKEKSDWIGSCVITIVLASSLVAYMSYRYLVDPRQDEIVATHSSGGLEDPVIVEGAEFKMKSCQKANKQIICIVVIDAPADLSSIRVIGLPAVGRAIYATELKLKDKEVIVDDYPASSRMELQSAKLNELTLVFHLSEVRTLRQDVIDVRIGFDLGKGKFHVEFRNVPISDA